METRTCSAVINIDSVQQCTFKSFHKLILKLSSIEIACINIESPSHFLRALKIKCTKIGRNLLKSMPKRLTSTYDGEARLSVASKTSDFDNFFFFLKSVTQPFHNLCQKLFLLIYHLGATRSGFPLLRNPNSTCHKV